MIRFSEHICIIILIKLASNEHSECLSATASIPAVLCSEMRTGK